MKVFYVLWLVMLSAVAKGEGFEDYFYPKTMRFDFYHCGTAMTEEYYFDEIVEEPYWAGSPKALIDTFGYGNQYFKIIDKKSGREIYSCGYCTLFNEWQSTEEAKRVRRAMPESVVFPFPKDEVRIEIYSRNRKGKLEKKYEQDIDPENYHIRRFVPHYETFEVMYNGVPEHCVDIVLIPEGYGEGERGRFEKACEEFAAIFSKYEPYVRNRMRINVRAVWAPSAESGVTLPGEHVWRNTAAKAAFYTFDSERYQTVEDFQNLRDIAAHVPYEYIYVLSNTQKYGGGGIYNFYGISAAHHPSQHDNVYIHEFGHQFAGLGDEYDYGSEEMYLKDVEPWEPNLTTLSRGFRNKMWYKMLPQGCQIPTPYTHDLQNKVGVGVYEGGGYSEKGIYRPSPACMMKQFNVSEFCPVCTDAIQRRIDFLCQ